MIGKAMKEEISKVYWPEFTLERSFLWKYKMHYNLKGQV